MDIEISTEDKNTANRNNTNNNNDNNDGDNKRKLKLKITQTQEEKDNGSGMGNLEDGNTVFEFPIEVRIVLSNGYNGQRSQETHVIPISKKITENAFSIPSDAKIETISIDPESKILKKVKSIKVAAETKDLQLKGLLINQLHHGKTVIERIDAARLLQNLYSKDVVVALQNSVMGDKFYGVSIEAANAIGSFYDKNDYEKSDSAYQSLKACLTNWDSFNGFNSKVKRSIIKNIGMFERDESIDLLEAYVTVNGDDGDGGSDFIKSAAATAMGRSGKRLPSSPSGKKMNS